MSELALPIDWEFSTLGDIADIVSGMGFPKHFQGKSEGEFPVFKVGDISSVWKDGQSTLIKSPNNLSREEAAEIKGKIHPQGTIVFAKIGEALRLNRRAMLGQPSLVDNNVMGLVPRVQVVDKKYLYYFMTTVDLGELSRATAVPSVRKSDVQNIKFPLAPLEQQNRIVSEIEKQFSRLDEAVANLKRVKANLKRYKAAVLKAAVEGKLTEEWRKQHPDVEPADKLLERISNEREDRFQRSLLEWQDAVADWEASGKEGKKPAKPRKPKNLPALEKNELSVLPLLPKGWSWTRLGNLNVDVFDGPFGSNLKSSDYVDDGVRVVRLENIGSMEFVDAKVSFVTKKKYAQLKKHTVGAGDLIFSSFVADGTRVVMLPAHVETAINKADCFCVRTFGESLSGHYLETFLATRIAYEQLVVQVHGATRPRINTTQLKDCPVSLPPEAEQSAIINEVTRQLSIIEVLSGELDTNILRADRLRQSVLKKAFSGDLVS